MGRLGEWGGSSSGQEKAKPTDKQGKRLANFSGEPVSARPPAAVARPKSSWGEKEVDNRPTLVDVEEVTTPMAAQQLPEAGTEKPKIGPISKQFIWDSQRGKEK